MEEIQNIKNLLQNVSEISSKYEEIAKITGENFNIFKIMNMQSDEVKLHSAFLAELLNPKGTHGQGDVFLKLFVEQFDIKDFETENAAAEVEKYIGRKTETEGGRIDIAVNSGNRNIFIENKIYAEDQPQQLLRYHNEDKSAVLFYLTLYGTDASENSTGNKNANYYKPISYSYDILNWLKLCKKETVNFPVLRETITQYINTIKSLTGQTMNEKMENEIVNTIAEDEKLILAAYKINELYNTLKIETELRFWNDLETVIKEDKYKILDLQKYNYGKVHDYYTKSRDIDPYYGILFSLYEKGNINICFFIENSFSEMNAGITAVRDKNDRKINKEDIFNDIVSKLNKISIKDSHNEWWLANFKYMPALNWKSGQKEVQLMINNKHRTNFIENFWSHIKRYIQDSKRLTNNFNF